MTKTDAAKTFFDVAAQLRHEGLLGGAAGAVEAALRGEKGYYFAELNDSTAVDDTPVRQKPLDAEDDPIAAVFAHKPDATTVFLLPGVYALQISKTKKRLAAELDDMAQIVGLTARVAKDETPAELLRCLKGRNSCFVKNRGMLITGRSATEAVTGAILLEKAAMTHLLAKKIGGAKRVPLFSAKLMHAVYQKKYSKINLSEEITRNQGAEKPAMRSYSERESELRQQIVDYGKRLMEEGLVQGTWGNLAVRLDEAHMLVTPSGLDYRMLSPDDVVKVELETMRYESERKPTSEKQLHRDLFLARPDVGAAIHTHAKNCGVFAAARKAVCPAEGEMLLCAPHALPSTKKLSRVAIKALGDRSACLLMNHGVLCCGADLRQAYEGCKSSEQAAGKLLGL